MAKSRLLPAHDRLSRRLRLAVAGTSVALAAGLLLAPPASATGRVLVIGPGADLTAALGSLTAGDVLRLRPGTYDVGRVRPWVLQPGTPSAPIIVTADNPWVPPLIRGSLRLVGADYWHLSRLRVQSTVATAPALDMTDGIGWSVVGSEFWGARQTGAYANVFIAGSPNQFSFSGNCVHDAAVTHPRWQDHNLYVGFAGNASTSGTIERNLIFGEPNGAGIKLGVGGVLNARGPWNLKVQYNTIAGGIPIRLFGDVRGNNLHGNLLYDGQMRFSARGHTMGVSAENITVPLSNPISNTWVTKADQPTWDNLHGLRNYGDVRLRVDPKLIGMTSCGGLKPTTPAAMNYGKYAPVPPVS